MSANRRLGQINAAGTPYAAPVKAESPAVCCRPRRSRVHLRIVIDLGSGLIDYSQKMTMAAMQIADMNV